MFRDFARLMASCSLCEARVSSILSRYTDKTKQAKLSFLLSFFNSYRNRFRGHNRRYRMFIN